MTFTTEHELEPASTFRRFSVGAVAEREARALGYTAKQIGDFARRAAHYRDANATHRFRDLAFVIDGDTVTAVWPIVY